MMPCNPAELIIGVNYSYFLFLLQMRLQQEANQKIAELAERAHTEAIAWVSESLHWNNKCIKLYLRDSILFSFSNLDETTRSVYKENVRVNEALSYHMAEGDKLKQITEKLEHENGDLQSEQELNQLVIKDKVAQAKQQKNLIKQVSGRCWKQSIFALHMKSRLLISWLGFCVFFTYFLQYYIIMAYTTGMHIIEVPPLNCWISIEMLMPLSQVDCLSTVHYIVGQGSVLLHYIQAGDWVKPSLIFHVHVLDL